jgi:hypothetical protein
MAAVPWGHCGWNPQGPGAACADIELAMGGIIRIRAGDRVARGANEKIIAVAAVPICRHEISVAANAQHDVARHASPQNATQFDVANENTNFSTRQIR